MFTCIFSVSPFTRQRNNITWGRQNSHLYVYHSLLNLTVKTTVRSSDWFLTKLRTKSSWLLFYGSQCRCILCVNLAFSALTLLTGCHKEHPACKNWVIRCWCGYLFGTRCRLFAYGPADATVSQNPIISCRFKSRLVLPLWYQLTQVVLEMRPLNGCSNCSSVLCIINLPFPADVLVTGLLVRDSGPSVPDTDSAAYDVHGDLAHFSYQEQASDDWKTQVVADELSYCDAYTLALLPI